MFTGIIEETGTLINVRRHTSGASLTIGGQKVLEDVHIGDSIAVNGICLTVTSFSGNAFTVDVMPETIHRTSLKELSNGSPVNLERAMAMNSRFGGHIVSGHIDGVGTIQKAEENDNAVILTISAAPELIDGIVPKGSVTLDGISLTVVDVSSSWFTVSLIPHTRQVTNLREKRIGDIINIETDMIGKYVKKYLNQSPSQEETSGKLSLEYLSEKGFL